MPGVFLTHEARGDAARVALSLQERKGALAVLERMPVSIQSREDGAEIQVGG